MRFKFFYFTYIRIFNFLDDFFVFFLESRIDGMIAKFGAALGIGVTQALERPSDNWSRTNNIVENQFRVLERKENTFFELLLSDFGMLNKQSRYFWMRDW